MRILWLFLLMAPVWADTVRFQKVAEPREGAFTVLIPAGWKASGGIVRVDPTAAGGTLNAIGAKLDFTITSDDGRVVLHWYPETNYIDLRGQPAGPLYRAGSIYNGAVVWPKANAASYLQQAFSRARPRASNVRIKGTYPLPKAAASYQQVISRMGVPIAFQFDVALIVVEYQEGGAAYEEALYTAVQDWGQMGSGLWTNKDTFSLRAPAGGLEKAGRVVSLMLNSVQLNPKWVEGEIRGQIARGEISRRTLEDIQRLDREIVEHRRRTNAEINNQMYHTLMGTEEYVNPLTRQTEVGSNAWNHRWVNDRGEAVYTDDPNFDPVRAGLQGYVKSPVRKRFPDR